MLACDEAACSLVRSTAAYALGLTLGSPLQLLTLVLVGAASAITAGAGGLHPGPWLRRFSRLIAVVLVASGSQLVVRR